MKKKDLALIIVVIVLAAILSTVASKFLITAKKSGLTAETVEKLNASFNPPDDSIFNSNAINPTKLIRIGDSTNPSPF
jgi:hypothetical protein